MDNATVSLTPPSTAVLPIDAGERPPPRRTIYRESDLIGDAARSTVVFTDASHRGDFVAAYPELEETCAAIGFGPGIPLSEWCANPDWALLVLARAAQPPAPSPRLDWSLAYIPGLIPHLIAHHHRPLRNELRRLAVIVRQFALRHNDENGHNLRDQALQGEGDLNAFMDHEEASVFPLALTCDQAQRDGAPLDGDAGDISTSVHAMTAGHRQSMDCLQRILITIDMLSVGCADPDIAIIRAGVVAMISETYLHAVLELGVLAPAAIFSSERMLLGRKGAEEANRLNSVRQIMAACAHADAGAPAL